MSVKRKATICVAALACAVLLAGCSGGASSSASSAASAAAGASATAASSSASGGESASASSGSDSNEGSASSSASQSDDESSTSSRSESASGDFDRALIGEWHIYSSETSKNATKKTSPERTALMRERGLHDTLTFLSDGDVLVNKGGGKVAPYPWFATDENNKYEIEGMLDDPNIEGDDGEDKVVTATLASNRLTLEYDTDDEGHVKLVYSKS